MLSTANPSWGPAAIALAPLSTLCGLCHERVAMAQLPLCSVAPRVHGAIAGERIGGLVARSDGYDFAQVVQAGRTFAVADLDRHIRSVAFVSTLAVAELAAVIRSPRPDGSVGFEREAEVAAMGDRDDFGEAAHGDREAL